MQIIETGFEGLYIIQPKIYTDDRGYFFESYKLEMFLKAGIPFNPVQDNESKSSKGVIRGLHYQLEPFAQAIPRPMPAHGTAQAPVGRW